MEVRIDHWEANTTWYSTVHIPLPLETYVNSKQ